MGVEPVKIICVIILSFGVALMNSPQLLLLPKKGNKQVKGKFVILKDRSNKK